MDCLQLYICQLKQGLGFRYQFVNVTWFLTCFSINVQNEKLKKAQGNYLHLLLRKQSASPTLEKEAGGNRQIVFLLEMNSDRFNVQPHKTCWVSGGLILICVFRMQLLTGHVCMFLFDLMLRLPDSRFPVTVLILCSHWLRAHRVVPVVWMQHLMWKGPHDQNKNDKNRTTVWRNSVPRNCATYKMSSEEMPERAGYGKKALEGGPREEKKRTSEKEHWQWAISRWGWNHWLVCSCPAFW